MTKRVLVAPLDWGLGHATRCIPIINELLAFNCEVIIGSNGFALALLKREFPQLSFAELPAYNPAYSNRSMVVSMMKQLPKFLKVMKREHEVIERIVDEFNIDIVISDNRYGCWSRKVKCIFITHQINILLPRSLAWFGGILNYFNHQAIKRFNLCWVPDYEGVGALAYKLSHNSDLKGRFIGTLSRFDKCLPEQSFRYKVLVILSGPEPQRSNLEKILITQIQGANLKALLVRGVLGDSKMKINDQFEVVDFLESKQLNKLVCLSDMIIARSGYSTIMDLARLGKKVIFIPTPGQTEQAYLGMVLQEKGVALSAPQQNFNLINALAQASKYAGFSIIESDDDSLKSAIAEVVQ
jgi:uncharacterized protein (TIGR00661 family)